MTLVFDRRDALQGQPMTHALIVGVSQYHFLPGSEQPPDAEKFNLRKLGSCALSAWEICLWLAANADTLASKLGTIRVLLAPSPQESLRAIPMPMIPGWVVQGPQQIDDADWDHFIKEARAWRDDAAKANKDGLTFFYYSGHGLKQVNKDLITFADFTDPDGGGRLQRSCELVANFVQGMAPTNSRSAIARNQFYFVDCCREDITDPSIVASYPGTVWDTLGGIDDRATPIFMASYPGSIAMAIEGQPTDFCKALLISFDTGSDEPDPNPKKGWPVTSHALNKALERHFTELRTGQYAPSTGVSTKNIPLRWLSGPPPIEFSVVISPATAVEITTISVQHIKNPPGKTYGVATERHPFRVRSFAGIHKIDTVSKGGFETYSDFLQISPFWTELPIELTPRVIEAQKTTGGGNGA